jgi:hypothetical protein
METPRPYRQRTLRDGTILREFRSEAHPDELVWHQDRARRSVRVVESGGWKLQLEEGLPFPLVEGNTYEIPSRSWHRVIRGPGDLKIEIVEGDNVRITESQLRKIVREEIGRLSENVGMSPGPIASSQEFKALQPGDRIKVNGSPCVVVEYDSFSATLKYTQEGKSTLSSLDARLAWAWEPGERPEISVEWISTGAPPNRVRRAPRRRTSYSYYD